jgi:SPP1 family predicted phage head-tail adaptor
MALSGLNRRIQIQSQSTTQDSLGQQLQTWTTIYTCWASIDIQQSQLIYATAEFISKVTHRITFRWTSSVVIQPQMRILYTEATTSVTHIYNIEALLNTKQRNRELVAICYELDASE